MFHTSREKEVQMVVDMQLGTAFSAAQKRNGMTVFFMKMNLVGDTKKALHKEWVPDDTELKEFKVRTRIALHAHLH